MMLNIGDFAPAFTARSSLNPAMRLDHLAGRFIALTFINGSAKPKSLQLAESLRGDDNPFDDKNAMHFFVVLGETGEVKAGIAAKRPGHRVYFDKTGDIAAKYDISAEVSKPITFILSPRLQIAHIVTHTDVADHAFEILGFLKDKSPHSFSTMPAPVLLIPDVLEGELRHKLLGQAKRLFLMEKAQAKLPSDSTSSDDLRRVIALESAIGDEELNEKVIRRIMKRVIPELRRAFAFNTLHIDDVKLMMLRASDNARIDPMREGEGKAFAHRRFSLYLRIDMEELAGGTHHFPEFSPQGICVKPQQTLVFSSLILHEIKALTEGEAVYIVAHVGVTPQK